MPGSSPLVGTLTELESVPAAGPAVVVCVASLAAVAVVRRAAVVVAERRVAVGCGVRLDVSIGHVTRPVHRCRWTVGALGGAESVAHRPGDLPVRHSHPS